MLEVTGFRIFRVLCLMTEIMIYRLPIEDTIDRKNVNKFKKKLEEIQDYD